jgi:hypothetical protein
MAEKLEFLGKWFLPDNSGYKISGRLVFLPNEGATLELIGCFPNQDNSSSLYGVGNHIQIIQGEGYSSGNRCEKVTLVNCWVSAISAHFPAPFHITKYGCQFVIVGTLLPNADEARFNSIQAGFTELNDWIFPRMIQHMPYRDENVAFSVAMSKDNLSDIKVDIDKQTKILLLGKGQYSATMNVHSLSQQMLCKIECTEGKRTLYDLFEKAEIFKQFLSLAAFSTVTYSDITLHDTEDGDHMSSIRLYYAESAISEKSKRKRGNFLFDYSIVKDVFPVIIKKWYDESNGKDFSPIRWHLIKSIQRRLVFDSTDFLIIVQSIEGYHRRYINNKKRHLYERIEEIVSKFSDIDRIKKLSFEPKVIADLRNYYSHFYKEEDSQVEIRDGMELFLLFRKIRLLLICCVLDVVGFQKDKINEILTNCQNEAVNFLE